MSDRSGRPIRLLSLDGGGVRGLSSLIILQHIMSGVNTSRDPNDQLQPWQVFDMIGGTSTGGIIAIMLGRLRMTLDECEEAYLRLSKRIFQPKRKFRVASKAADFLQANGRFDCAKLEEVIKECVRSKTDEDALLKDGDPQCKVFVCAARAKNTEPALLRSYHNPKMAEVLFNECRIWEACRATSAATTFFDPVTIGKYGQTFVDGAVLYNNPVQLVQREASHIWPGRKALMVSIGTGAAPARSFEGNLLKIAMGMKNMVTQTERTANDFYLANQEMAEDRRLFRFNVTRGMDGVGLEEYREIGAVADATQSYLDHAETNEKLGLCIERLAGDGGAGKDEGTAADTDYLALLAQQAVEAERRAMVEWLSPLNFFVRQADILSLRVEGTGQWLLESDEFKRWLTGPDETTLWCSGIPGAGKTVLASIVVDHLQKMFPPDSSDGGKGDDGNDDGNDDGKKTGIAFVYCSHQERIQQTPVNLVGSILKQLAQERPALCDLLKPLYLGHRRHGTAPTLAEVSDCLRNAVVPRYGRVFVVVDALDECPEHNGFRDALLLELAALSACDGGGRVRLLVTSRPHISIEYDIAGAVPLEIRADEGDLRKYLERRLLRAHRLIRYVRPDEELRGRIVDTVLGNAQGMFLLAQLHMDLIATKATQNEIRQALENLPRGLDESYRDALRRIESQNADDCSRAKRTLYWVSHALRPLTVAELQAALAVMPGGRRVDRGDVVHQDILLSVCAGLVVVDSESNVFRMVHFSAQRFFEETRGDVFPGAQVDIAGTCLTYLSFEAFAEGPCPTDQALESRLAENPLLGYAAGSWGDHLRGRPEEVPEARTLALEFLGREASVASSVQVRSVSKLEREGWSQEFPTRVGSLQIAAGFALAHITRLLVEERGADVCASDSLGGTALHEAAGVGSDEIVSFLLARGAEVGAETTDGATPLVRAIVGGHEGTALLLVDGGSSLEVVDPYKGTVLHTSAYNGDLGAMRLLLERGADVAARDDHQNTALHVAAHFGSLAMVQMLLESLGEGSQRGQAIVNAKNKYGLSPLHYAAFGSFEEIARALLDKGGAEVDLRDMRGSTPLHMAAEAGSEAVVRLLLDRGAEPGRRSEAGWFASRADDPADETHAMISLILWEEAQGTRLRQVAEEMPTLRRTNTDMRNPSGPPVQNMMEGSAFVLPTMSYGGTPLNRAVFRGHLGVVRILVVERGADVHSRDDTGTPALWRAAVGGHEAIVSLLLDHGADVDARDEGRMLDGGTAGGGGGGGVTACYDPWVVDQAGAVSARGTALSRAAFYGHPGAVGLLLERGADPGLRDSSGATALHTAAGAIRSEAVDEVLRVLLQSPAAAALLEARDARGRTPLLAAALARNVAGVRRLLEEGADIDAVAGTTGSGAFHLVAEGDEQVVCSARDGDGDAGGHQCGHCDAGADVVRLLAERGADVDRRDADGLTPLFLAALEGWDRIAWSLVECDADVNVRDGAGNPLLHRCVQEGHLKVVKVLLERCQVGGGAASSGGGSGGGVEGKGKGRVRLDVDALDEHGVTALYWAVREGEEEIARLLVGRWQADVNSTTAAFDSPLQEAVADGKAGIVRLLLGTGRLGQEDLEGALMTAVLEGMEEIVLMLLEAGAGKGPVTRLAEVGDQARHREGGDVGEQEPEEEADEQLTLANAAISNDRGAILRLLISHGVPLDDPGQLLTNACLWGCWEAALVLLREGGVGVDVRDSLGCSALHSAAGQGDEEAVRFLVAQGADVRAQQSGEGPTPLFWAANRGHVGILKFLLEGGRNPYTNKTLATGGDGDGDGDGDGRLPGRREPESEWALHAAAVGGHDEAVAVLLDHGADIEALFDERRQCATALYWAAEAGHESVVRLLLERGARRDTASEPGGFTAEQVAKRNGFDGVVSILRGWVEGGGGGRGRDG